MKILFVCSGNTCRSPMAMALFERHLVDRGAVDRFHAFSAGVYAVPGDAASRHSIVVMKEYGIDLRPHRAKLLQAGLVEGSDFIVTMTRQHLRLMKGKYPHRANNIYILSAFSGDPSRDVLDPFGGEIGVYRESAAQINDLTEQLLDQLLASGGRREE